jgi:hypothetical protein
VFLPERRERSNAFALLRVCRRIYAETAVLPFFANTISIGDCWLLRRDARRLRTSQRNQVTELSIEVHTSEHGLDDEEHRVFLEGELRMGKFALFPSLQRLNFYLFSSNHWQNKSFLECETRIRSFFEADLRARAYVMLVEKMSMDHKIFDQRYVQDLY